MVISLAYKCYAVRVGRKTGVFTSWKECQAQIIKFPDACYKGFKNKAEAMKWLKQDYLHLDTSDYEIYTDGSCLVNPGVGGWAAIVFHNGDKQELAGGQSSTTNNRMELTAVIRALKQTDEGSTIILHTDSQYVQKAFTEQWIQNWKRNNWRNAHNEEVANKDLWVQLWDLVSKRTIDFRWVRGHNGNEYNERCDQLAVQAANQQKAGNNAD